MSHYTTIQCKLTIKDLEHIKEACKELGLTFRVGGQVRFYYSSNQQNADYVISIPGCSYDVGLKKKVNGDFELVYDKFNGQVEKVLGKDCCRLTQSAIYHKIVRHAKLNGKLMIKKREGKLGESIYVEITA